MFGFVICLALAGDVTVAEQAEPVTQNDVQAVARRHRIQLYNLFRTDRPEYDARMELAQKAAELSAKLNRESAAQLTVATWFEQAATAATDGTEAPPLPEIPQSEFEQLATSPAAPRPARRLGNLPPSNLNTRPTATQLPSFTPPSLPESAAPETKPSGGGLLQTLGEMFLPPDATDSPAETDSESFELTD